MQSNNTQMIHVAQPAQHKELSVMELMELAIRSGATHEVIAHLKSMKETESYKTKESEFFTALSDFQSSLPVISKDGKTYNGTNYAKLEDIAQAIKPMLPRFGLSYYFECKTEAVNGSILVAVTCVVKHKCGYSIKTTLKSFSDSTKGMNSNQAVGSSVTYLKRYTLTSALGIAVGGEDDDGESQGAFFKDGQACEIDYHYKLKLTLASKEKSKKGYRAKVMERLSNKYERKIGNVSELSTEEARETLMAIMNGC